MARKRKVPERAPLFDDLAPHTKQAIGAVGFVVLGVYFTLALIGYAGVVGSYTNSVLAYLFGSGSYLAPLVCFSYVIALMRPKENQEVSFSKIIGIAMMFLALLGYLELYSEKLGGLGGWLVEAPLSILFGNIATGVMLGALLLVGIFLTFNTGLRLPRFGKKEVSEAEEEDDFLPEPVLSETEEAPEAEADKEKPETTTKKSMGERLGITKSVDFVVSSFDGPYDPPPLSLLKKDSGKSKSGDVKANANVIKRTLKNFNIDVEMDAVEVGPSVTRYAFKPAQGVKISRIVGLQRELELNLALGTIRIEAPIPGKSLVGIEVPNIEKTSIGLASLLSSAEYTDSPKPLFVALGKGITGNVMFANIARMPHALIAGATGSGKSVTIHNLIISLLFRNSPEQLRFIMVDPKRVELTLYNDIPHLLTPVITDAKKALRSLQWAVKEMERRYDILQSEKVQNIESYHSKVYQPAKQKWVEDGRPEEDRATLPEPLPYVVIVMDELADLMHSYPKELEALIVRLAAMSRAIGIHLILATQRPSVNVITGTIKANIPTRIALQVISQIDSRTILDQVGAEKLLGKGDMLYLSAEMNKPMRLQSAFISEDEVHNVVKYLKTQTGAHELDSINLDMEKEAGSDSIYGSQIGSDDDDDLYEDAKQAVIEAGKASTSYIQRKLRVGYSRAARLMDLLEERGVIGAADGAKPREIITNQNDGNDNDNEK
jgi:DNA segregation ATPase FtsK/SpoIIIE, S-DNA-T family